MRVLLALILMIPGLSWGAGFNKSEFPLLTYNEFMSLNQQKRLRYLDDMTKILITMEKHQRKYMASNDPAVESLRDQVAQFMQWAALMPEAVADTNVMDDVPEWDSDAKKYKCHSGEVRYESQVAGCVFNGKFDSATNGHIPCADGATWVLFNNSGSGEFDSNRTGYCVTKGSWDNLDETFQKQLGHVTQAFMYDKNAMSNLKGTPFSKGGDAIALKSSWATKGKGWALPKCDFAKNQCSCSPADSVRFEPAVAGCVLISGPITQKVNMPGGIGGLVDKVTCPEERTHSVEVGGKTYCETSNSWYQLKKETRNSLEAGNPMSTDQAMKELAAVNGPQDPQGVSGLKDGKDGCEQNLPPQRVCQKVSVGKRNGLKDKHNRCESGGFFGGTFDKGRAGVGCNLNIPDFWKQDDAKCAQTPGFRLCNPVVFCAGIESTNAFGREPICAKQFDRRTAENMDDRCRAAVEARVQRSSPSTPIRRCDNKKDNLGFDQEPAFNRFNEDLAGFYDDICKDGSQAAANCLLCNDVGGQAQAAKCRAIVARNENSQGDGRPPSAR